MEKLEKVEYIVVHHSERTIDSPFFIRFRHKYLRRWEDTGYHFLIANGNIFTINGELCIGLPESSIGSHAWGYNRNSLGVCLVGNFDEVAPSQKQLSALFSFLKDKVQEYNIPIKNILGHRELPGVTKSCPGKLIDMDYIREKLIK
jgi:N-acetylmuramoyl-L-alanine amidase